MAPVNTLSDWRWKWPIDALDIPPPYPVPPPEAVAEPTGSAETILESVNSDVLDIAPAETVAQSGSCAESTSEPVITCTSPETVTCTSPETVTTTGTSPRHNLTSPETVTTTGTSPRHNRTSPETVTPTAISPRHDLTSPENSGCPDEILTSTDHEMVVGETAETIGFVDEELPLELRQYLALKRDEVSLPAPATAWHDIDLDISTPAGAEERSITNPYGDIYLDFRPTSSASNAAIGPERLLVGAPGHYQDNIQNVVRPPSQSSTDPRHVTSPGNSWRIAEAANTANKHFEQKAMTFLAQVPLFKRLPKSDHPQLAGAMGLKSFRVGEFVIRQGEMGDEFFVIFKGSAQVFLQQEGGEEKLVANLKVGDYFGEGGLLAEEPRKATIKASEQLEALSITREKFQELGLHDKIRFAKRNDIEREALEMEFSKEAHTLLGKNRKNRCWDDELFQKLRDQAVASGFYRSLERLRGVVLKGTEDVLRTGTYTRQDMKNVEFNVTAFPKVRWFGERNALTPAPNALRKGLLGVPPVVCVASSPLDVAIEVANLEHAHGRRVVVSFEATDFAADGSLKASTTLQTEQQAFIQRSDFTKFAAAAAHQLGRSAASTCKQHLEALQDPYIFIAQGVTVFRGSESKGFPFLDSAVTVDAIVSTMWTDRPDTRKGYYRTEKDQAALFQRLNLTGLTAADHERDEAEDIQAWIKWNPNEGDLQPPAEKQPILVMSVPGCIHGGRHPRKAVANSLRHFRISHARFFSAILIACGEDRVLAREIDSVANADVYDEYEKDKKVAQWHWDEDVVALGVKRVTMSGVGLDWIARQGRANWHATYNEGELTKRVNCDTQMDIADHRRRSSAVNVFAGALLENTTAAREAEVDYTTEQAKEAKRDVLLQELLSQKGRETEGRDADPLDVGRGPSRGSVSRGSVSEFPRLDGSVSRGSVSRGSVGAKRASVAPPVPVGLTGTAGERPEWTITTTESPPPPASRVDQSSVAPPPPVAKTPAAPAASPSQKRVSILESAKAKQEEKKAMHFFGPSTNRAMRPDEEVFNRVSTLATSVAEQMSIKLVANYTHRRDARAKARAQSSSYAQRQLLMRQKERDPHSAFSQVAHGDGERSKSVQLGKVSTRLTAIMRPSISNKPGSKSVSLAVSQ